jgi:hypothetical protein
MHFTLRTYNNLTHSTISYFQAAPGCSTFFRKEFKGQEIKEFCHATQGKGVQGYY